MISMVEHDLYGILGENFVISNPKKHTLNAQYGHRTNQAKRELAVQIELVERLRILSGPGNLIITASFQRTH